MTTLTRHPGGASVQVHARIDESFTLVYDAVVARAGAAAALPAAVATGVAVAEPVSGATPAEPEDDAEILQDNLTAGAGLAAGFAKWSPDSGETVHDRLAAIVGGGGGLVPAALEVIFARSPAGHRPLGGLTIATIPVAIASAKYAGCIAASCDLR